MPLCSRFVLFFAGVLFAGSLFAAESFPGAGKIQPELLSRMLAPAPSAQIRKDAGVAVEPTRRRVIVTLEEVAIAESGTLSAGFDAGATLKTLRVQVDKIQTQVLEGTPADLREHVLTRYHTIAGFSGHFTDQQIKALAAKPGVTNIARMPVYHVMDAEAHPLTNVNQVHSLGYTGEGTVIAIIDSGIDATHAAFGGYAGFPNPKIIAGYDFADYDPDPTIDCLAQTHGTAVAGVAAGNGGGVTGSAPDARIVFLKVQSASECGEGTLSGDVLAAIDWIINNKASYNIDIISMSLGAGSFSSVCDGLFPSYANAMERATNAGLIILAASGNSGMCHAISRPACFSDVISVGAVYDANVGFKGYCVSSNSCIGQYRQVCASSGMSACIDSSTAADMVTCYSNSASFLDILSPSTCATTAKAGGGTLSCFGGTSSATSYAAGTAAALLEAAGGSGSLNNSEMRALLANNGVPVYDPKNGLTKPRIDALASLQALNPGGGNSDPVALTNGVPVTGISGGAGEARMFTLDVPAGAGKLTFEMSGGSGEADLYVRFGAAPTTSVYDCRPYLWGNDESCTFNNPPAGTWYAMVYGYNSFAGITLVGEYRTGTPAPCSNCTKYTGYLNNASDSEIEPNGDYYYAATGTHEGWLDGPGSADFDLELYRWNGSNWDRVALSNNYGSSEHISYFGGAGYYLWQVESYSGSGSYEFWLDRP